MLQMLLYFKEHKVPFLTGPFWLGTLNKLFYLMLCLLLADGPSGYLFPSPHEARLEFDKSWVNHLTVRPVYNYTFVNFTTTVLILLYLNSVKLNN